MRTCISSGMLATMWHSLFIPNLVLITAPLFWEGSLKLDYFSWLNNLKVLLRVIWKIRNCFGVLRNYIILVNIQTLYLRGSSFIILLFVLLYLSLQQGPEQKEERKKERQKERKRSPTHSLVIVAIARLTHNVRHILQHKSLYKFYKYLENLDK